MKKDSLTSLRNENNLLQFIKKYLKAAPLSQFRSFQVIFSL